MRALLGLMSVLAVPLMIVNMLGGIVSGIWLAVLGEWGAIGYGIAALVVSGLVLSIVLMPALLLLNLWYSRCTGSSARSQT